MKKIILLIAMVIGTSQLHAQQTATTLYNKQFFANGMIEYSGYPALNVSMQIINNSIFTVKDKYLSAGVALNIGKIYYKSIETSLTDPFVNTDNVLTATGVLGSFMWKGRNIKRKRSRSLQLQIGPSFAKKDTARFVLNGSNDFCTEIVTIEKPISLQINIYAQKHIPLNDNLVLNIGTGINAYRFSKTSIFYRNNNPPQSFIDTDGDMMVYWFVGLQF